MTAPTIGRIERFWSKVAVPDENGCLLWLASTDTRGYGQFNDGPRIRKAHQIALEIAGIEVPVGMEPDHTCEVRRCVNVEHMEIVTHLENVKRMAQRSTHCRSGRHRWDEQVPIMHGEGRECRPCRLEHRRERYAKGYVA